MPEIVEKVCEGQVLLTDRAHPSVAVVAPIEGQVASIDMARSGAFLRTRPFGRFPDPVAVPDAIFVSATDSEALAPDPRFYPAERDHMYGTAVGPYKTRRVTARNPGTWWTRSFGIKPIWA